MCFGFYNPRHEIGDLRANPLYEHSGGCFDNYNRTDYLVSAPLYQQAFRWFREKHNLKGGILYIGGLKPETTWWDIYVVGHYQPYEEAELACLKKLIEIVKNK
jgi:hypothetical protein